MVYEAGRGERESWGGRERQVRLGRTKARVWPVPPTSTPPTPSTFLSGLATRLVFRYELLAREEGVRYVPSSLWTFFYLCFPKKGILCCESYLAKISWSTLSWTDPFTISQEIDNLRMQVGDLLKKTMFGGIIRAPAELYWLPIKMIFDLKQYTRGQLFCSALCSIQ